MGIAIADGGPGVNRCLCLLLPAGADGKPAEVADLWQGGAVQAISKDRIRQVAGSRDRDTLVVLYAPWCKCVTPSTATC